LLELIAWGRSIDGVIYAPNANAADIFADLFPILGPWKSPLHRLAALMEAMRALAGLEASWLWACGVDTTNKQSQRLPECEESGIFQVSFNSTALAFQGHTMLPFARANGIDTPAKFIAAMKRDHVLAMTYFALLSRINLRWDGPLIRHEIDGCLSRAAVDAFLAILS
jgi:hypothetical protein